MMTLMIVTRRTTFRLYPTKSQEVKLHYWRRLHKDLFNACLYHRKTEYQRFGNSISYYDQQNILPEFKECWHEYKELGSQALQATVKRVDYAFQRFFSGLGGYPKFKSARHYRGWTYPATSGWKAHTTGDNGYLELSNLAQIQMRGKARTWGNPTTCTIIWKQGKWYASITVNCEPKRDTDTDAIGLDFGTYHAIACSDGTIIDNPKFLANTQQKIEQSSKKLRRKRAPNFKKKIKASKRWRKARKRISKLQSKVTNQRQDWQHKAAAQIVKSNSLVATEKLNIKGMTRKANKGSKRKHQKTGLNRSLLDVGIGNLISLIKYKLSECSGVFVDVPLKVAPSQTCPQCGHKKKKELSERVHNCGNCNFTADRDVAASMVMLNYALGLGTSLINADAEPLSKTTQNCGSFRKVQQLKRQKPRT
ncbi:putative transposase IS891/IS1136/IS1341 family protein [Fischerella sp. NIES-4106]|jgi:putative transposase|nr:putative transposase IS891/IS1136/IS1341 family protein [Fischerella sp. NIES-4106]